MEQEENRQYDMEITPERAQRIKEALIRQYEDQMGIKITGWKEIPKETAAPK